MIIDVLKLRIGKVNKIEIDETIEIDKEKLADTQIISINKLELKALITKGLENDYYIDGILSGIIVLPDSVDLKPVEIEFETEIEGNINELLEEIGQIDKKTTNSIDIFPILWENILMEIPIRVVDENSSNIKLEGEGWKLISDDEASNVNPELQKLNDLLKREVL